MNSNDNIVTSYIGRWVAFLVTPIVLAGCAYLSQHGIDLDPAATASFVVGLAVVIATWLYNRGKHEVAVVSHLTPDQVERIAAGVVQGMPPAPQAPPPGDDGAPAQPQAPPADAPVEPAPMSAAERRAEEARA